MSKRDIKAKRWAKRGMKRLFGNNWRYFWYSEQRAAGKKLPTSLFVDLSGGSVCRLDFGFMGRGNR